MSEDDELVLLESIERLERHIEGLAQDVLELVRKTEELAHHVRRINSRVAKLEQHADAGPGRI